MKTYLQELTLRWAVLPKSYKAGIILGAALLFTLIVCSFIGSLISSYKDKQYEKTMAELQIRENYYKEKVAEAEQEIENLDAQINVLLTTLKTASAGREQADQNAIIKRNQAKKSGAIYEQNKKLNSKPRLPGDIISDAELCKNGERAGSKPAWCE